MQPGLKSPLHAAFTTLMDGESSSSACALLFSSSISSCSVWSSSEVPPRSSEGAVQVV